MSYKAVIFDLDGTLVDTLADLGESMNYALASLGQPKHQIKAYRQMVGNGLRTFAMRALSSEKEALCGRALEIMRQHYADNCLINTKLYDGISETIAELHRKGIKLAVLTNKDQDLAERIINHFFTADTFEYVVGAVDVRPLKPHSQPVLKLMDMMQLSPPDIILVGDSDVDMDAALAAGIRPIGVNWGFRTREVLLEHNAAAVIDKPEQLLNLMA